MSTKFKKGDIVTVYNCTLGGRRFKEGVAKVIHKEDFGEDFYVVRFAGDRGLYSRNLIESEKL